MAIPSYHSAVPVPRLTEQQIKYNYNQIITIVKHHPINIKFDQQKKIFKMLCQIFIEMGGKTEELGELPKSFLSNKDRIQEKVKKFYENYKAVKEGCPEDKNALIYHIRRVAGILVDSYKKIDMTNFANPTDLFQIYYSDYRIAQNTRKEIDKAQGKIKKTSKTDPGKPMAKL